MEGMEVLEEEGEEGEEGENVVARQGKGALEEEVEEVEVCLVRRSVMIMRVVMEVLEGEGGELEARVWVMHERGRAILGEDLGFPEVHMLEGVGVERGWVEPFLFKRGELSQSPETSHFKIIK